MHHASGGSGEDGSFETDGAFESAVNAFTGALENAFEIARVAFEFALKRAHPGVEITPIITKFDRCVVTHASSGYDEAGVSIARGEDGHGVAGGEAVENGAHTSSPPVIRLTGLPRANA